ncbi:hypothetical protein NITHO_6510001 [Nitrolancea hollandica Lb]|uniref:Uncharacterized protein n=1 Tax=Nitrolancea hollandica Lb TaxID=1129897 RepID=I4EMT8_9BACT|nr:hypothetical protein NITHO_6510001 [Nitrolancea hollandica Lb]
MTDLPKISQRSVPDLGNSVVHYASPPNATAHYRVVTSCRYWFFAVLRHPLSKTPLVRALALL